MNYASISKNRISVDIFHKEEESLDWFYDNSVKLTPNKLPFICSDVKAGIEIMEASENEDFVDDYLEIYENNIRFSLVSHEGKFLLSVFMYPLSLSEEEIREEYEYPDGYSWCIVDDPYEAMNVIYEILKTLEVQEEFVLNSNFTFPGDYNYFLN